MSVDNSSLTDLRRAYQILGVPLDATAHSIKRTYPRLVKRWHPDLYASGTPAHLEAEHMTKLINEAYAAIVHAPLRYHTETFAHRPNRESGQQPSASAIEPSWSNTETVFKTDRLEFWVRFACGTAFGLFVILDFLISGMLDTLQSPTVLVLCGLAVILGFGLGAARYGDKFWHSILRRWWLWP